jgi:hypothetical protein
MSLVLNIGVYPPLLETRKLVLEHAGHVVITRTEDSEIAGACEEYQFDVVVIGQSASAPIKRRILRQICRHCGSVKVLKLFSSDSGKALLGADSWLEVQPMEACALAVNWRVPESIPNLSSLSLFFKKAKNPPLRMLTQVADHLVPNPDFETF